MWRPLADEVVAEILWRLPLNSIIRCRCVCKSWYSLITTSYFILTHLRKTLLSKNIQHFLYECDIGVHRPGNSISLLFNINQNCLEKRELHLPTDPFLRFKVVSSCNGILCLVDLSYGYWFVLSNPSIRHSVSLPKPRYAPRHGFNLQLLGFGFDHTNHDHKIVRIVQTKNDWAAEMYSLNLNCWRDLSIASLPGYSILCSDPAACLAACVKGRLHWVVHDANHNTNLIMVFDFEDETFSQILLPNCLAHSQHKLLAVKEYEGSSILVVQLALEYDIWAMKEYGEVASWRELTTKEVVSDSTKTYSKEFLKHIKESCKRKSLAQYTTIQKYVPSLLLLDYQHNVSQSTQC